MPGKAVAPGDQAVPASEGLRSSRRAQCVPRKSGLKPSRPIILNAIFRDPLADNAYIPLQLCRSTVLVSIKGET